MKLRDCPFEKIYPSELQRDAEYYMALAYNQAIEAWQQDEVPIGAVIEHQGRVIASAHNQSRATNDPTAHAEVLAISQAANTLGDWRLNACTLYVTKEPCPMCSGAVIMSRVGQVIYGVPDTKMGCLGGAYSVHLLEGVNHRVDVKSGVLANECYALLQSFFKLKRVRE